MDKNHCKKQYSVRLPPFWSAISSAKPLQKTVRRALPSFLHLIFVTRHQKVVQNYCKKQHVVQPHSFPVLSNPSTPPNPNCRTVAKPLQKHHFARLHLLSASSATLSISLTSRHVFALSTGFLCILKISKVTWMDICLSDHVHQLE